MTEHLGVYALGAADEAERTLVESHLTTCPECRAELAFLEPLPGLLARVPVGLRPDDAQPGPTPARPTPARPIPAGAGPPGRARRWPAVVGAAAAGAAAVAGAAGGFWLAQPGSSPHGASPAPAAVTLSGANPATQVRVSVRLTATSWGTSIRLMAWGLPLNQPCRLIVRSRAGRTEVTGAWDAWRRGPVSIPASADWRPADIVSLRVATASRSLVTVKAR